MFPHLKHNLLVSWRNLTKHKMYTFLNLMSLSVGLAAVMLILLYVKDEFSFDRFHKDGKQIYRIVHESRDPTGKEGGGGNSGGIEGPTFVAEIPEIISFCRLQSNGSTLIKMQNDVVSEPVLFTDSSFFNLFSFPLLSGNPQTVLKRSDQAVVSKAFALKHFQSLDVVGKILEINQDGQFRPYQISGVAENTPSNSSIQINLVLSIQPMLQQPWTQEWLTSFLNTFVKVRPGTPMSMLNEKMEALFERHVGERFAQFRKKFGNSIYYRYRLQPLHSLHIGNYYNAGNGLKPASNIKYSYILSGVALFILLIACINFINLSLSQSFRRSKEIGVRKVAGSSRKQLVFQFLGEALLLNFFAIVLALGIAFFTLPFFATISNKALSFSDLFSIQNFLLFIGLLLINTLLSGAYPALVLSRFQPTQVFSGKIKLLSHHHLGKILVVTQFSIAVFLIISMFVMQKQFIFFINQSPGYNSSNIIDLDLAGQSPDLKAMKNELLRHPAIKQVGSQSISFTDFNNTMIKADNKEIYDVALFKMDEQILSMLQIPMAAGRNFNGTGADSLSCIINESLAHISGWENPIGQTIHWQNRDLTIVGVVKDFHVNSFKEKMHPTFIHQLPAWQTNHLLIKTAPNQIEEAINVIRKVYKSFIPYHPCNYNFLDDMLASQYQDEKRWKNMISTAAGLAIFIACMGLFGLASLSIEQRTKEIGVRKVLGASSAQLLKVLSSSFIWLVGLSLLIASPIAWWASQIWLHDFAYKISVSWELFALAGIGVIGLALLTMSIHIFKLAKANPVESLRNE